MVAVTVFFRSICVICLSRGIPKCRVISLARHVEVFSLSDRNSFFGTKTAGSQHAPPIERDACIIWRVSRIPRNFDS